MAADPQSSDPCSKTVLVSGMQGKVSLSVFFLFGRQFYAAPTGYVAEMIL